MQSESSTAKANPTPSPRARIDYTVRGHIPSLKQPDKMSCWATAATILLSWKDDRQYTIEETIQRAGSKYLQIFDTKQGLEADEKKPFLQAMGLRSENPQSFTVNGWLSLLQTYGPLWVTTQLKRERPEQEKFSVHARILIGMYETVEGGQVQFRVIDPETGTQYDERVEDFVRRYENIANEDLTMNTEFQPQVIHF